jgi:hypothetical protein
MTWNSILFICVHLRHLRLILLLSPHSDPIGFVRGDCREPDWLRSGKRPRPG